MSLIDDIKAVAKEDADLSGIESQIGGYINSSDITTDNFIEIAKKHPKLLSAFDSQVSKRVESGVNNFKEKDMVALLKSREEEIRAEINPKETPAEKRIRELEAKIEAQENKEKMASMKDELSIKAKDKGFEPLLAREFAGLENADSLIDKVLEWHNGILGTAVKGRFDQTPPKGGGIEKGLSNMTDSELYAAAKADPANKAAIIEEVNRRMRPK